MTSQSGGRNSRGAKRESGTLDLIRVDDFKSIKTSVSLVNKTSKMELRQEKKRLGDGSEKVADHRMGESFAIHFVEFVGEKGIVLDLPSQCGATGHVVQVEIEARGSGVDVRFVGVGKIQVVDGLPNGRARVEIGFFQIEEVPWQALRTTFERKQGEVEKLFNAIKGGGE